MFLPSCDAHGYGLWARTRTVPSEWGHGTIDADASLPVSLPRNRGFFQAEAGIRAYKVTGVQTCALPISKIGKKSTPTWLPSPSLTSASFFGRLSDRKSTRLNSSHLVISYAVFCLKK